MNCEEVKISLHDFVDELLDGFIKRDVEAHIRTCDTCFNEYKKIRIFFDKLKDLPYIIEPPEEIVKTFSAQLLNRSLKDETPESAPRSGDIKKLKKNKQSRENNFKERAWRFARVLFLNNDSFQKYTFTSIYGRQLE